MALTLSLGVMVVCAQGWSPSLANRSIYSVCSNPQNPSTLYAGNVSRSIFKSYDGGEVWEERSIGQPGGQSLIQCLAVHPRDTNIVFAGGTGLAGVYRSTDGGDTWAACLESPDGYRFELGGSGALTFDPNHPDTVYCVRFAFGEVYRSADAGANWEKISTLPKIEPTDNMRAVTVCPDSSNIVMVSGRKCRIYRSTNYGITWATYDSLTTHRDTDVGNFAWSLTTPGTVYAAVQMSLVIYPVNSGLFKSTDYGRTWRRIAHQDTSLYAILINRTSNGEEIFLGGNQFDFPADPSGLLDGDSIVLRSRGSDTVYSDIGDVPWLENEIGDVGTNVWGFAITRRNGLPMLAMATNGGLFISNRVTSASSPLPSVTSRSLTVTSEGFMIPSECWEGAWYAVYDLSGRIVQQGKGMAAQHISIPTAMAGCCIVVVFVGLQVFQSVVVR